MPNSFEQTTLATGRYIGEGFDDARLDTLFLAMPVSWRGTLQQYVGRLQRHHDNKQVVQVYDYVDTHVPTLTRMYKKPLKGYEAIGYSVHNQGS
jgi:superfamily II DNA or RNA helicase